MSGLWLLLFIPAVIVAWAIAMVAIAWMTWSIREIFHD